MLQSHYFDGKTEAGCDEAGHTHHPQGRASRHERPGAERGSHRQSDRREHQIHHHQVLRIHQVLQEHLKILVLQLLQKL